MKLSRYLLPTLRDAPSDADNVSARLMIRAGMVRKIASGIYEWLPLGLRVLRKAERIVREEMDAIGALEVSLPVVQPKELWQETGRWQVYGKELLRISDRKKAEFCFAPTAEEVITDLARREIRSWRQLPLALYQIGLKFRDEIRPRFGVMRAREFLMKDAYSFHADEKEAEAGYWRFYEAYKKVFSRCGLRFKPVEAHSGAIGGSFSHEFMVLAETGEETVVSCLSCDYAANLERAEVLAAGAAADPALFAPIQESSTPGLGSVAEVAKHLGEPPEKFLKTQLFIADSKPLMALVRGDHELNDSKLARATGAAMLRRMNDKEYVEHMGCPLGFAGPQGRTPDFPIYADFAIRGVLNGVTGANKPDFHARNVNYPRDYSIKGFFDLRLATPRDPCPRCGQATEFVRGIEVGHTFKLGTKYSTTLEAVYLDRQQKPQPLVMGCYGIGVSRVVAAAVEQGNDKDGILWPSALAPYHCAVVIVETEDHSVRAAAEALVKDLEGLGIEVLEDDRPERPGVKFKDADLVGIPFRLVVSVKTLARGAVEFKRRGDAASEDWPPAEAPRRLRGLLDSALGEPPIRRVAC